MEVFSFLLTLLKKCTNKVTEAQTSILTIVSMHFSPKMVIIPACKFSFYVRKSLSDPAFS
jgi:hypothetical protein